MAPCGLVGCHWQVSVPTAGDGERAGVSHYGPPVPPPAAGSAQQEPWSWPGCSWGGLAWLGLIFHVHLLCLSCLLHVTLPRKALQPASKAKHFCKAHAKVLRRVILGLLGVGEDFLSLKFHVPTPLAGSASRLHLLNTVKCVEVVSTPSSLTAPSSPHHCSPILSSSHCPLPFLYLPKGFTVPLLLPAGVVLLRSPHAKMGSSRVAREGHWEEMNVVADPSELWTHEPTALMFLTPNVPSPAYLCYFIAACYLNFQRALALVIMTAVVVFFICWGIFKKHCGAKVLLLLRPIGKCFQKSWPWLRW